MEPISRERIHDAIVEISDGLQEQIRQELKSVNVVSATSDLWSDVNGRHWATISLHWIDLETFTYRVKNIGVIPVAEKSGVAIADIIEDHVRKFIDPSTTRLLCVVTDRGGDMLLAAKLLEGTLNSPDNLISCIAHILHNAVTDALEKDKSVALVRDICVFFRNNNREIVRSLCEYQVLKDQDTRWSSIYFMIFRFVALSDTLKAEFEFELRQFFDADSFKEQWDDLLHNCHTLLLVLDPFYKSTDFLQGNYISISAVPSIVYSILEKMISHPKRDLPVQAELKQKLFDALKKRTKHIFRADSIYLSAAFLDPKYNELSFLLPDLPPYADGTPTPTPTPAQILIGIDVRRNQVLKNLSLLYAKTFVGAHQPELEPRPEPVEPVDSVQALENLIEEVTTLPSLSEAEIELYDTAASNLRAKLRARQSTMAPSASFFWSHQKTYPSLKKLAAAILSVPGSSAESERAFSIMGRIISKYRTNALFETSKSRFMVASNILKVSGDVGQFFRKELKELTLAKVQCYRTQESGEGTLPPEQIVIE